MSKENKSPTPLATMLGNGGSLDIKEKSYTVKPITLNDTEDFMNDNLSLDTQLLNMTDKKTKAKVDRWLAGYCFDGEGNPVPLKKAMTDGWDIVDLKEFFRKLCDLSG